MVAMLSEEESTADSPLAMRTWAAGSEMATIDHPCPIARTVSLIGDRWTPLIVRDLRPGSQRFSELQRSLHGISPKTLADRLRRLEESGVISRTCYAEMPPRVEYGLTAKGHALLVVVESMREFGDVWLVDHTADGCASASWDT